MAALQNKSIAQLEEAFGNFIPHEAIDTSSSDSFFRRRVFSAENTFRAFLSQVLSAGRGCQEVIRKIQAFASLKGAPIPSSSTAAYCKARAKLDPENLRTVFKHTAHEMNGLSSRQAHWGRRVVVVDGTGFSMPDTLENNACWPKQSQHKEGCGFPEGRLAGCFDLQSGGLLSYAYGNKHDAELTLFRHQRSLLEKGDIVLGDKGFCNYRDMALLQKEGIGSVMSLRKKMFRKSDIVKKLGENDYLAKWKRPHRYKPYTAEEWGQLPPFILVRHLRIKAEVPGFRPEEICVVTTLKDSEVYTFEELGDLYFERWDAELFSRDIKTTMGMDILRCKTPGMIIKELALHLIAYNCIRRLIVEAAEEGGVSIRKVSFKGALQALRNWEPHLNQTRISKKERFRMISELYGCIAQKTTPDRPGRSEPRAVKRRPKNHRLLTKPRHEMVVPSPRNRNWENKCKITLS